jgi:hypothetical protein
MIERLEITEETNSPTHPPQKVKRQKILEWLKPRD